MQAVRILGVDPGSRLTGYGCVDWSAGKLTHVTHGTLRLSNTGGKAVIPLEERLLSIHEGLSKVILEFKPEIISIERVFFAKNAVSALKLGQARGAVVLCGAIHRLKMVEYSPSEVKSALVGHGQADKTQVAKMVQLLIGRGDFATSDASDGLALAICHAQHLSTSARRPSAYSAAVTDNLGRRGKKRMSLAECVGVAADLGKGRSR